MRYVAEVKVFQGMSQAGLMKPASSRVHAMGIQVVQCIQLLHGASRATYHCATQYPAIRSGLRLESFALLFTVIIDVKLVVPI